MMNIAHNKYDGIIIHTLNNDSDNFSILLDIELIV